MAVDTRSLPDPGEGRVYQLWTGHEGEMIDAGVLTPADTGAAMDMPEPGDTVNLTVEPAGGSEQPTSDPIVTVDLTTEGTQAFKELTTRLADAGREDGRTHHAAVVVGDEIVALASVPAEQYPDGIETTQLQFFAVDQADAEAIANRINGD